METTTNFETNFPNPEAESELLRIAGALDTRVRHIRSRK
jgi:hypothetical protein